MIPAKAVAFAALYCALSGQCHAQLIAYIVTNIAGALISGTAGPPAVVTYLSVMTQNVAEAVVDNSTFTTVYSNCTVAAAAAATAGATAAAAAVTG